MQQHHIILGVLAALVICLIGAGCTTPQLAGNNTTTSSGMTTISLVANNMAFDKTTITVPRGAAVTINFNNQDSGIPHNFAIYQDSSAAQTIFKGQIVNGPGTATYSFTAPAQPGTYFFRCDVHPTQMTGQFVVT